MPTGAAVGQAAKAGFAVGQRARRGACVADVAQDRGEVHAAVDLDMRDRRFGIEQAAVGALALHVAALAHALGGARRVREVAHMLVVVRALRGRDPARQRRADRVGGLAAEDALGAFVEDDDVVRIVDHDHRVVGDREQAGEQGAGVGDGHVHQSRIRRV